MLVVVCIVNSDMVLNFDKKREHGSLRSVGDTSKKGTVENA